jgi:hypothetical protein
MDAKTALDDDDNEARHHMALNPLSFAELVP